MKTLVGAAEPPEPGRRCGRTHAVFFGTPGFTGATIVTTGAAPAGQTTATAGSDVVSAIRYVVHRNPLAGR